MRVHNARLQLLVCDRVADGHFTLIDLAEDGYRPMYIEAIGARFIKLIIFSNNLISWTF